MKELVGHGVALITPFKKNGEVDYNAIPKIIDHLINGGVDYLVVLGTTGETATLSDNEKKHLISTIVKYNSGRIPLVIGIGGNNTNEVIKNINSTDLSPFVAILSVTPFYNKPNQEGLYHHFGAIARNSSLPIVLYNVPSRTGVNLLPQTVLRLANDFSKMYDREKGKYVKLPNHKTEDAHVFFTAMTRAKLSLTMPISDDEE